MSAFGENLRREREMRGVSLEEISSATKISMRFLEAIEREDFSILPGGIFSRSFIRSYAKYLGLDEERTVAEFQLAARPQADFDLHRMATGTSAAAQPRARTPLVATLVAVVLLAGGYVLFRYSRQAAENTTPPPPAPLVTPKVATPAPPPPPCTDSTGIPAPVTGEEAPGTAPLPKPNCTPVQTPPPTSVAGETPPGAAPGTTLAPGANPGGPPTAATTNPPETKPGADTDLVLQVAATERAWVAVDADGKTVLQRVLNPDEVQTLKAHKSFEVTAGNAQAVILTLNGQTLKPLGRRGEVGKVRLTHDDLKNSAQ